jgi:hypothetical protein
LPVSPSALSPRILATVLTKIPGTRGAVNFHVITLNPG